MDYKIIVDYVSPFIRWQYRKIFISGVYSVQNPIGSLLHRIFKACSLKI